MSSLEIQDIPSKFICQYYVGDNFIFLDMIIVIAANFKEVGAGF
jgi:hypothetical protein